MKRNRMNYDELKCFVDEINYQVDHSNDREELSHNVMSVVDDTSYERGWEDETEILGELSVLIDEEDEWGFTALKNEIKRICADALEKTK